MAKVNQNKLIGGLAVAVITLLVVIVIVVVAKELFPANTRNSSSTVIGTDTNQLVTAAPVTTTTTTTTSATQEQQPPETTTPQQGEDPQETTTTTSAQSTADLSGQTVYLNTSVYLRSSASWGSDKGAVIPKGESATVVRTEGDWYVLEYGGSQGYVYQEYVSLAPVA